MSDESSKSKKTEIRFITAPRLWEYLGWLARHTVLGETENDVARHILTQRLSEMRREDYHDPDRT